MSEPLVTIGMPVWNGEAYLARTIRSLLDQTYRNLELIILDNLSTDRTSSICQEFAARDSRVRYIVDDRKRDVSRAHARIMDLARGELFMVACDDDEYEAVYIESLVYLLERNPSVGLAFSNWGSVDERGTKTPEIVRSPFTAADSRFANFARYLFFRRPVPICFGVIRTELHRQALAYFARPDERGWNHDNLYMLRLLSLTNVDYCPQRFFYYRVRDREALYRRRGQFREVESTLHRFANELGHQRAVSRVISTILDRSSFSLFERTILRALNQMSWIAVVVLSFSGPRTLYRAARSAFGHSAHT